MKKILIVGSNSIHCKRYINVLIASKCFDLFFITNQPVDGLTIPQVSIDFSLKNLGAAKQIFKCLELWRPDIIHIHQANSYAWHTIRALKKLDYRPKIILTTWGSDILVLPHKNKIFRRMVIYNLRHADIITADALFMSNSIRELLGKIVCPIHILNFGIENLPQKQDLLLKEKIILSNRLHKKLYRIDTIIQAFAQLIQLQMIDKDYRLVIAANGEELPVLKAQVDKLGIKDHVSFVGMLDYEALLSYYKKATVFVSIPRSDGTPSSLLEAMAHGCIPVLSNIPANLEWVLDGINGFIANQIDQLAAQILEAINLSKQHDSYQDLNNLNYKIITKKADAANNLTKFMELYS